MLAPTKSLFFSILLLVHFSRAIVQNDTMTIIREYTIASSCSGERTLWKIITSCVTTLFACTWTAIHPNMPGPVESGLAVAIRRLGIMILALVAPEIVVMWAIRQLFAARMAQKRFEEALRDGTFEVRVKPCCEPRLVSARVPYDADEVKLTVLEPTIESWSGKLSLFCCSIIAMFHRTSSCDHKRIGPSVVSIESLRGYCHWTLKHSFYAWMGGFVLFVDKDPDLPCEIYYPLTPDELFEFLEADFVQVSMVSEKDLDDRSKGDWLSKTIAVLQLAWFVAHLAARAFEELPTTQLEIDALAVSILACFIYGFWWYKPKNVHCPVPVYWKEPGELPEIKYSIPQTINQFMCALGVKESWIGDCFNDTFRPLLNLGGIGCVSDTAVKAHRVPYFCGYPQDMDRETLAQNLPVLVAGALAGTVFGGIHCIASNFTFPTHTEQILWRIATLIMTIMPGCALAAIAYVHLATGGETVPHATAMIRSSFAIGMIYVICRLTVMVLILLSLRSLPAGVYVEVCWTTLLLHLS